MLPEDNAVWPPPDCEAPYAQIRRLASWYSDETDMLYGGQAGSSSQAEATWLARFGRRATSSAASTLSTMHMPVAGDIARTSADLLFADMPDINLVNEVGAPVEEAQKFWDDAADDMDLEAQLLVGAELCAALSGIYWRVTWDATVSPDRPIIEWVQPDFAVPEFVHGILVAVTVWGQLGTPKGQPSGQVWRHLERYSAGQIEHGLFVGTEDNLGRRAPLTEHPATESIQLTGPDFIALPAGIPMLMGYIPNMLPNRKLRLSKLGRADISGMERPDGPLAGIDKAWSSWMRDLDLGKGRITVPEDYLRTDGAGSGAVFDLDRAVYTPLRMPLSSDGQSALTISQFDIRDEVHARTVLALLTQVVRGAGYSLGSFGIADGTGPAQTATEVRQRNALSMTTREKKIRYWRSGLRKLLGAYAAMDRELFGGKIPAGTRFDVEFSDAVAEDPHRVAETVNLLFQAQAASTRTRVEIVHPDWDETRVSDEVAAIKADTDIAVPTPLNDGESTTVDPFGTPSADLP